jgi:hypothetical protein
MTALKRLTARGEESDENRLAQRLLVLEDLSDSLRHGRYGAKLKDGERGGIGRTGKEATIGGSTGLDRLALLKDWVYQRMETTTVAAHQ